MDIKLPYGKEQLTLSVPDAKLKGVLTSRLHEMKSSGNESDTVKAALENPIGKERLSALVCDKNKILVITSDHTRPVPSKITMPLLLEEIRLGNPKAEIIILVATGVHRECTKNELEDKFGKKITENEVIKVHNAFEQDNMVFKGVLPSKSPLYINKLVDWADFTVAEGFIEPHFFAGFSGGRKSILPGIASAVTVMSNHSSVLIDDKHSRTGVLDGNLIHEDMKEAARLAGLSFILNVVIDSDKKIVKAFAGDPFAAHEAGCAFVGDVCSVKAETADIVVTTNGGYPLDQNVYQAVKSMTAAEACVNMGGVIICASKCSDGSGGEEFFKWFRDSDGPADVMQKIMKIPFDKTIGDQWQAQILARVMLRASVIVVADECAKSTVEGMGMIYFDNIEDALKKAVEIKPCFDGIVAIPDGVSVIIRE